MKDVIAIVGPTASGKTKLAIEMAQELNTQIISADSRLVYKGFDIGTAKPTKEEQSLVKHYMIDIVEPEVQYSVADYAKEAKSIIDDMHLQGKMPIVVGGTGLYFRILLENYSLSDIDTNEELRAELDAKDVEELYKQLVELDRLSAETIHKNDKKRLVRAIEVSLITGKPYSQVKATKDSEYNVKWVFPEIPSREWLYDRINKRVYNMLDDGLIDETKLLLEKHGRTMNLVKTIGYQEIIKYLDGEYSLDRAVELIQQNSRRYAKRQLTWFRRNENLSFDI